MSGMRASRVALYPGAGPSNIDIRNSAGVFSRKGKPFSCTLLCVRVGVKDGSSICCDYTTRRLRKRPALFRLAIELRSKWPLRFVKYNGLATVRTDLLPPDIMGTGYSTLLKPKGVFDLCKRVALSGRRIRGLFSI